MILSENHFKYVEAVRSDLIGHVTHNKLSVERLAEKFGIENKNIVKELTEFAIVRIAREIAIDCSATEKDRFDKIVALYSNQVNLSHRTSHSVLLQQYSTPAPIGFLASLYVSYRNNPGEKYFEPSAGTGLLTLCLPVSETTVNELDPVRNAILSQQGFMAVTKEDATRPFTDYYKRFSGVVTNPPFGNLDYPVDYDGYQIRVMDHLMALRALDTMRDDGKAAIIIGGHTQWDANDRIQAGKNRIFFNYLYSHYDVDDVLQIDGHKLYSRQGTSFDVRLILISGRKPIASGNAPLKTEKDIVITTFEQLWHRVSVLLQRDMEKKKINALSRIKIAAQKIIEKRKTSANGI
jgi:hypothetical protein